MKKLILAIFVFQTVFLNSVSLSLADTIKLHCTNDGGTEGPPLEIDTENRVIYVGTVRNKNHISSITERYITYVHYREVGGDFNVLDLATGIHSSIAIGVAQGTVKSFVPVDMKCVRNILN